VDAASESALIYGWCANAGFAAALWLLGRLGGTAPRGLRFATVGAAFWNLGVLAGVAGIFAGDMSGYARLQLPYYVWPLLLIAGILISVSGILAWSDRQIRPAYASQWYAVCSVFVLPWVLSAAGLSLFVFAGQGVAPSIAASWASQVLASLWLGSLALAVAYYLIPKLTGEPIPHYGFADVGLWTLIVFAPWTGTRVLAGGPLPAWIPVVGIATSLVLLFHYLVIAVNLGPVITRLGSSQVLRFIALSVLSYIVTGLLGCLSSLYSVAHWLQFTYWGEAQSLLLVFGVFSPAMFAAIYYLVPRITGRPWASDGLIFQHVRFATLGTLATVVGLLIAGATQGTSLASKDAAILDLVEGLKPWLLVSSFGILLQLIGGIFLLVNLAYQLKPDCCSSTPQNPSLAQAS
jgi:cytochrome c oxidase cbb3-type subunit 1